MGWTSEVRLHVRAPALVARRVRRRFTHKGFQNFTENHRGLIGLDLDDHAEAHARFSALAKEKVDEEELRLLKGLAEQIPSAGGLGAELAGQIAALAAEWHGELFYEFSIWKDNVVEVANRIVRVVDRAMSDELGPRWRDLKLPSEALFVHAYAGLGMRHEMRFDLTPQLRQRCEVVFDLFMDGMGDEGDEDACSVDTSGFEPFTAELMTAHEESDPEAFGCHDGGRGCTVRLEGLQAKPELNGLLGQLLGPVDLETGRWPVALQGCRRLSVRRQNLVLSSHRTW